jgi:uncharacterized protein YeeX (DUF496 family)
MDNLALIAEFENDIRRERQMDGTKKARERGIRFGRKPLLVAETIQKVKKLRKSAKTVPDTIRRTGLKCIVRLDDYEIGTGEKCNRQRPLRRTADRLHRLRSMELGRKQAPLHGVAVTHGEEFATKLQTNHAAQHGIGHQS